MYVERDRYLCIGWSENVSLAFLSVFFLLFFFFFTPSPRLTLCLLLFPHHLLLLLALRSVLLLLLLVRVDVRIVCCLHAGQLEVLCLSRSFGLSFTEATDVNLLQYFGVLSPNIQELQLNGYRYLYPSLSPLSLHRLFFSLFSSSSPPLNFVLSLPFVRRPVIRLRASMGRWTKEKKRKRDRHRESAKEQGGWRRRKKKKKTFLDCKSSWRDRFTRYR